MRRALLLLALTACASGQTFSEDTTPRQAAIYSGPETGTILGERPRAVGMSIPAAPAAVWLAVKSVYTEWEIPVTVENPSVHQIGNQNFYKTRTMAGRPMPEWVDCGSGMTGPKAGSYRIYISLLTDVSPDGQGGTKVQTTFIPVGQDMMGNSTDRIPCGSTGRLEAAFLAKVKAIVAK
ncbi:MAG TPA: hypothetical protein VIP11_04905 [Gemmatimonadaceae bacterium]